ncbi:MAG: patatin-like phospholipase family protein [Cyclobacteriaceae bacterium]|nr:patatin-like phospholipase family protein [Cyclobacteriaceae bacterium]MCK5471424.1 patatin-like phospholipase family protein [Cyclobacteriaceae bacterium]
MKKIGVSLSGGGSRGIVHLGILKAIDEAGIKLSMVTGTSAGAIVGAFYCSGYSPDNIMEIIMETKLFKYVRPAISFSGLLKLETIVSVFKKYLKNDSFDALNIPLVVAATNVRTGTNAFLHDGPLVQSILASCAVPVIFEPIKLNGEIYIDGGILNNLPVEPLIGHCDVIIGINCNPISENYEPGNMKSLLERSLLMAISVNTFSKKGLCDLFLEPDGLKNFGGFDFSKAGEIFQIGYEYGKSSIDKIKVLL